MGAGVTKRQMGVAARSVAQNGMRTLRKVGLEPVYQKATLTRWGQAVAVFPDGTKVSIYGSVIGPASNGESAMESIMKITLPDNTSEYYCSLSGRGEMPCKGYWFQGTQRLEKLKKKNDKKTVFKSPEEFKKHRSK